MQSLKKTTYWVAVAVLAATVPQFTFAENNPRMESVYLQQNIVQDPLCI